MGDSTSTTFYDALRRALALHLTHHHARPDLAGVGAMEMARRHSVLHFRADREGVAMASMNRPHLHRMNDGEDINMIPFPERE